MKCKIVFALMTSFLLLPFQLTPIDELVASDLLVNALSECHQIQSAYTLDVNSRAPWVLRRDRHHS